MTAQTGNNKNLTMIAKKLTEAGYYTAQIGKCACLSQPLFSAPVRLECLELTRRHDWKRRWVLGDCAGHQGFFSHEYTPHGRGFNTSFGFLGGGEDHLSQCHGCGTRPFVCLQASILAAAPS